MNGDMAAEESVIADFDMAAEHDVVGEVDVVADHGNRGRHGSRP